MTRKITTTLVLAAGMAVGTAQAQDVEAGRHIAQTWCRNCHNVTPDAGRGNDARPPSFASVAQMPSTTNISLAVFLSTPHARMPDFSLSQQEIRDVSAYILSLRKTPP